MRQIYVVEQLFLQWLSLKMESMVFYLKTHLQKLFMDPLNYPMDIKRELIYMYIYTDLQSQLILEVVILLLNIV